MSSNDIFPSGLKEGKPFLMGDLSQTRPFEVDLILSETDLDLQEDWFPELSNRADRKPSDFYDYKNLTFCWVNFAIIFFFQFID